MNLRVMMKNKMLGCPAYSEAEQWCRVYGGCDNSCAIIQAYNSLLENDVEKAKSLLINNLQNS